MQSRLFALHLKMVGTKSFSRNKIIYTALLFICVVGFWLFENFYARAPYSVAGKGNAETSVPNALMPSSTTGAIVNHSYFTLSYSEKYEQAEWVAYILKKDQLTYDDQKRPFFIEDPKVSTASADWRNYKNSGFDRGHLCPAGDRRFSVEAFNETFYTSNISPQVSEFNAGIWNRLELRIRKWAKKFGTLFIITGGVLENGMEEIGEEGVAVPKYFYKIVARGEPGNLKVMGYLMKAEESSRPLSSFIVSIDEIEKRTGINFFEKLPDGEEAKLESKIDTNDWEF